MTDFMKQAKPKIANIVFSKRKTDNWNTLFNECGTVDGKARNLPLCDENNTRLIELLLGAAWAI